MAGQFALLISLVVVPAGALWPRGVVVWTLGGLLIMAGGVIGVIAGSRLGNNLTPNPIPKEGGGLETGGLYRWVKHPIYTAVLAIGTGLAALGASVAHLLIVLALVMLMGVKARVEERLLREKFPDYREYEARTGRFLPGIGRRSPGRGRLVKESRG